MAMASSKPLAMPLVWSFSFVLSPRRPAGAVGVGVSSFPGLGLETVEPARWTRCGLPSRHARQLPGDTGAEHAAAVLSSRQSLSTIFNLYRNEPHETVVNCGNRHLFKEPIVSIVEQARATRNILPHWCSAPQRNALCTGSCYNDVSPERNLLIQHSITVYELYRNVTAR
jgi:hypothetical protein